MFLAGDTVIARELDLDFICQQPNDISTFYAFGRKFSGTCHEPVPVDSPVFSSRRKI
jgi:hypothetical protein